MFVDRARIEARAGDGGAGVASFRKARGRPRGKPEGGSGGTGGDVVCQADPSVATLLAYQRRPVHRAESGAHGRGGLQHGRGGRDLILKVPVGTIIREEDGTILADLVAPGQRVVLVRGGRGGRGNAALTSPAHIAPGFCEQGEYGTRGVFLLELKVMTDAALIGFPNAGKSTFIARVSSATPKIADYPFTTLEPHLGVVTVDDRELVLADVPGLVEGAAEGKGLGHDFLRHTERARALVVLLDPSPLQELPVAEQHRVLVDELERHSSELTTRPRVVAANKIDLPEVRAAVPEIEAWARENRIAIRFLSALTGEGVPAVLHRIADCVELAERQAPQREGFVLHRPTGAPLEVRREGDTWVVSGRAAERAIALDDLTVPEAADFAARRLARAGVDEVLRRMGAEPGDQVRIGEIVFEYQPDEDAHPSGEG
ncbi:MAG: GTPase ObgE [Acidimicrobiia bacterium]